MRNQNHIFFILLFFVLHSSWAVTTKNIDSLLQVVASNQEEQKDLQLIESYFQLGTAYMESD